MCVFSLNLAYFPDIILWDLSKDSVTKMKFRLLYGIGCLGAELNQIFEAILYL